MLASKLAFWFLSVGKQAAFLNVNYMRSQTSTDRI
jgi:hypothetical protein